jgi:hypothetical protein
MGFTTLLVHQSDGRSELSDTLRNAAAHRADSGLTLVAESPDMVAFEIH